MSIARERVDALAARLIAAGATPGAAVAVADGERILWAGYYGHADPAAARPVAAHTLFEIGSISKSFTAACLLRQWQAGRLDHDAEMRTVLPWFPFEGITVHHLLSHTGGIVCSLGDPPSPAAEVLALADTARAPAGCGFWYSNVGYQALGYALERLTGEPFAEIYRREIIEPLGLTQHRATHDDRGAAAARRRPRALRRRPAVAARRSAGAPRPGSSTAAVTAASARPWRTWRHTGAASWPATRWPIGWRRRSSRIRRTTAGTGTA